MRNEATAKRTKFRTELAPLKAWEEGAPRLNGPQVFGVRPGSPFHFPVAATGARPLTFRATGLPAGLAIAPDTGIIAGCVTKKTRARARITATNRFGTAERELRIVAGDKIALTPPLGWNSWNVWAASIDYRSNTVVRDCENSRFSGALSTSKWVT
jgi:hypothetical protein